MDTSNSLLSSCYYYYDNILITYIEKQDTEFIPTKAGQADKEKFAKAVLA